MKAAPAKQAWHGETHGFSLAAFAMHVAVKLARSETTGPAGPFFVEQPALAWLPYVGGDLPRMCFVCRRLRPELHRVWAVALIVFHIATFLTIDVMFSKNVLLLVLLCVASPFAPQAPSGPHVARALPDVGLCVAG